MKNLLKFRMKAFALIAILLVSISGTFAQQKKIVIIDAGSSKSKLYVYTVDKGQKKVECIDSKVPTKTEALQGSALSNVADDKNAVKNYIETMTGLYVPTDSVDLYILATAGMRAVDEGKASSIYKKIKKTKPNGKYRIKEAMTISGRHEGLYAWIAANYDKNTLPGRNGVTREKSLGILEIGGASMQIAFAPQFISTQIQNDTIIHPIYGNLYLKSYIKGGVNSVYNETNNRLNPQYSYFVPKLLSLPRELKFYGLGGTINGTNTKAFQSNKTFVQYINEYDADITKDTPEHYFFNTYYLRWLLWQLNLLEEGKITPVEADWTKGAVYDIIINGESPEAFNYDMDNPN